MPRFVTNCAGYTLNSGFFTVHSCELEVHCREFAIQAYRQRAGGDRKRVLYPLPRSQRMNEGDVHALPLFLVCSRAQAHLHCGNTLECGGVSHNQQMVIALEMDRTTDFIIDGQHPICRTSSIQ